VLRLRTLGGLSIERTDGATTPVSATAARRRLAVLAVLATSGSRGVPRDKLLALFWPESDIDRARHSLDQALYALKRDLDVDNLLLGREELSLNPAVITSDVGDFRAALAGGEQAAAVELYKGAFLDGVFVSGAPDFERWAEDERAALTREVEQAIETLATEASARGDRQAAVQWWQRLAVRNPRKTRVVVALMSELAATGDRAGALRHAEMYHTLVRDDADVDPNPAVAELAEKLKRVPASSPGSPVPAVTPHAPPVRAPTPERPAPEPPLSARRASRADTPALTTLQRLGPYRFAAAAVTLMAVIVLLTAWLLRPRAPVAERAWILVADFENRTRDSVFDRTIDAALTTGLQQSAYVNIFPRLRVQQTLVRMGRARTSAGPARLDETLAREIAQREGISAVVAGTIDGIDSSYMITARLVNPKTGVAIAAESRVAKGRREVVAALDDLVRRLRRDIGESAVSLSKHDRPLPQVTTSSLEALQKYADAVIAAGTGRQQVAMELWHGALALDSNFALAHAELGAAYYFANDRPNGDRHYDRALALLDRLTDRERLLVRAGVESFRGNRERAIELRRTLLAEYPDDPYAWGRIGYDYMRLGRDRDAIDALKRQIARDSSSAAAFINLATSYKGTGEYDEAVRNYRRAFAIAPTYLTVLNLNHEYGAALVLAGRFDDARATFDTMAHGDADQQAQGRRSHALLSMLRGRYGDAIEHLRAATLLSQRPGRELSEARNRLFLAAAQDEKGWTDSARTQRRAAYALFHTAYFSPPFLMYLGKALARDGQLALASEVLDSLVRRAKPTIPTDRTNMLVLAGEIALAKGQADSALRSFRLAYAADSGGYVAESLARGLAAAGDLEGGARMHQALATSIPRWYGWEAEQPGLVASFNAAVLYERMSDTLRARANYQRLLGQWALGDSDLVTVREARSRLERLREGGKSLQPERR
jgi:DNA-binding SARP family transcriptional activator